MAHKSKQEITAIIASVLLAFVMWLYAMTDKNPMVPTTVDNIQVRLINAEALEQYGLALVPEQNFTVSLNIRGRTMDIITMADPANFDIVADLNNATFLKKGENNILVELRRTPAGIQIENPTGVPYYIKVKLEALDSKPVPVKIVLNGSVKEGYGYLEAITKPTEVTVKGPESYVNLVDRVEGQIDLTGKSNVINESIVIKPVDKNGNEIKYVTLESQVADVAVPVKPAKEVDVVVKTTGSIAQDKVLKSINVSTEKVMIMGDRKYLDKVSRIETLPYDISKISATYTDALTLNLPEGIDVFNGMDTVNVEFLIENIIEDTLKIPVSVVNSREGYSYSTSVPDVNLTVRGAESIIKSLDIKSISAALDVNNLDAGQHNLNLTINVPNGVSIVKTVPDKVSVTITKPEGEATNP